MRGKFKPLAGQVVVVTGATSGLGLATARRAAKAGAAVVLVAADEQAVRQACEEIAKAGGRAHPVIGEPATADGCDRVARASVARFGRIDSWIEASGVEAALAHVAGAMARHRSTGEEPGALVGFGQRLDKTARTELRRAKGKISATLIALPEDWRHNSPVKTAMDAALHAVTKPMGRMAVAAKGKRLTAVTQIKKHPGVVVGVGLMVLAGAAIWLGRGRIAQAAASARPRVARAMRPALMGMLNRQPLAAAKLAARYPRASAKLARTLR